MLLGFFEEWKKPWLESRGVKNPKKKCGGKNPYKNREKHYLINKVRKPPLRYYNNVLLGFRESRQESIVFRLYEDSKLKREENE